MTPLGEPVPADVQSEFYYRAFTQTTYPIWMQACQQAAQGEYWPSIDALRNTIKLLSPQPAKITCDQSGHIDVDEFGRGLYETIFMVGEVLGLQDQINTAVLKDRPAAIQDFTARQAAKRTELTQKMLTLGEQEIDALVERYPVLVTL